jgi:hypothetical protein
MKATTEARAILAKVKQTARDKYAWPGGYPLVVVMADGSLLCPDCARREYRSIARETLRPAYDTGWRAAGAGSPAITESAPGSRAALCRPARRYL